MEISSERNEKPTLQKVPLSIFPSTYWRSYISKKSLNDDNSYEMTDKFVKVIDNFAGVTDKLVKVIDNFTEVTDNYRKNRLSPDLLSKITNDHFRCFVNSWTI